MRFKPTNLLIVDDDDSIVRSFERLSHERGWTHAVARNAEKALELLGTGIFEAAAVDVKLPGFTGLQFLEHLKQNNIRTEVVMMTGGASVESAVHAIRAGAYDYLQKPFDDIDRVAVVLERAMEHFRLILKIDSLERNASEEFSFEDLVGKSLKMQEVFTTIESIAPTSSTVLITGESGTGKELVAKAIHMRSKRRDKPFVVINCAAIPVHLLESELFGHRRGSFTGAIADKRGLFEEADGGTIFLDEISEVPPPIQAKLLRVLQDGESRAIGDLAAKIVDVRLIVATNIDLLVAVKEGRFREDLYYRINVIGISIPPLRERREDIPLLAYHFLKKYGAKMKKKVDKISVDALQSLQKYAWIGNVRELENVIERAVVLSDGDTIDARDLPARILGEAFYASGGSSSMDIFSLTYKNAKARALESFNRMYITGLLRETGGNISFASERAAMDRSNFKKLLKKCGIDTQEFKKDFEK
jgi:two-component system response regulator HydG